MMRHAYNVNEARKQLGGMSRAMFYGEIKKGRLRSFKVNSRRYVSDKAIGDYVVEREHENSGGGT